MVNISDIAYDAELITETGARYVLNGALLSLAWEEHENELAQRATAVAGNMAMENSWLMDLAKINCILRIYVRWGGGGRRLVFDGTIWEWGYASAVQRELTLTAYDPMIRLQQSRDFRYYPKGMTTQAIIADICSEWGIPLSYSWQHGTTHEKKAFAGEAISEMIIDILEEAKKKNGEKYVAFFRDGQLVITGYGTNADVYKFDRGCVISTSDKLSIGNLVTQVKIIGKQDGEGRASVDDVVKGDLRFGVLQEIVQNDSAKNLADARAEAETLLKERGKPEETISIEVPDLPFTRKGDLVSMAAGNLLGLFHVEGVTHNATDRKMTMELARIDAA